MSEKQMKEVKVMCRTFCIANKIKWSRTFERRYIKEFFESRRMNIESISKRRSMGIMRERRKEVRHKEGSVFNTPPAVEGDTD